VSDQQTLETEREKKENALLSINSDIPVLSFSYFLSFCLQYLFNNIMRYAIFSANQQYYTA